MSIKKAILILVASAVMLAVESEPIRALPLGQSSDPPGEALPGNGEEGVAQGLAATSDSSLVGYNFVIYNDGTLTEVYPAVAYNSDRQEYLVVWYNDRDGCDDIRAQRVSKNGALVGVAFYISAGCDHNRRFPDVAYSSQQKQYLVVWENEHPTTGYSIRGKRVSGTGAVLDSNDIVIQGESGLYTPVSPAVAYASTADRYLVVWSETWHPMPLAHYIVAQVVTPSGSLEGSEVTVSATDDKPRQNPDLAYNRARNEFLVAWQQKHTSWDIYGARVKMAGGAGVLGAPFAISTDAKDEVAPAVGAIPQSAGDGQYLVIWDHRHSSTDGDIHARMVAGGGTPGSFIIVSEPTVDQTYPAVAGNESGQRYLVTWSWQETAPPFVWSHISGCTVSLGGSVGKETSIGRLLANHPAVAAGPLGDFLVVFEYMGGIYGQLWGNRVYLPLVVR
jgi:uncharacterized protein YlbG (UPF0298 family)